MDEKQIEALAARLIQGMAETLQQARSVSDSVHYDHHKWIQAQIEREEAWRDLWRDMRVRLIQKGIWAVLLGIGGVMLYAATMWIRSQFIKG